MDHKKLQREVNEALRAETLRSLAPIKDRYFDGLSSGSVMLNLALSGSVAVGYEWGRCAEIYGPESSGKTTLGLHAVLEAQRHEERTKKPCPALYVDAENTLDVDYARKIGIDTSNLTIAQPDTGEDAFDVIMEAVRKGYKLVVVDSVPALVPRAEIEGDMADQHMGLHARLMSKGMRRLTGTGGPLAKNHAVVLFINQIRMKVGVVFGNPETTPGGYALKFYCTQRIEVRSPAAGKIEEKRLDKGTREMGRTTNIKVVKNKIYPPHRTAQIDIIYGKGIDRVADLIAAMSEVGVTKFKGVALKELEKKLRSGSSGLSVDDVIASLTVAEMTRRKGA